MPVHRKHRFNNMATQRYITALPAESPHITFTLGKRYGVRARIDTTKWLGCSTVYVYSLLWSPKEKKCWSCIVTLRYVTLGVTLVQKCFSQAPFGTSCGQFLRGHSVLQLPTKSSTAGYYAFLC